VGTKVSVDTVVLPFVVLVTNDRLVVVGWKVELVVIGKPVVVGAFPTKVCVDNVTIPFVVLVIVE